MTTRTIGINERLPLPQALPLALQHLFAMFGATVLVPWLVGLDTSVTLFTSGLGTLIYIFMTRGGIPAYLGSSFAFIAGMQAIIGMEFAFGKIAPPARVGAAMAGCVTVGIIYIVVALAIGKFGTGWIDRFLPPVVIGPVVMVIGLGLAQVAVAMATTGSGVAANLFDPTKYNGKFFAVAMAALAIAVLAAMFFKGFLGVIPILIGIVGGYVVAWMVGLVDLSAVKTAKAVAVPPFTLPVFDWKSIIVLAPVSLVVITEHIGHLIVTENVVGKKLVKDPGLHRSLAGDGVATAVAGMLGGPPSTTYGENIGVLAVTRVFSVWVIGLAAVIAIALSFLPSVGFVIRSIPVPVMGGICILLFGIIASSGIRMIVEAGIDFSQTRNLIITSVILVIGIGGAKIHLGGTEIGEMALATYVGVLLNLVLPAAKGTPEGKASAVPDV